LDVCFSQAKKNTLLAASLLVTATVSPAAMSIDDGNVTDYGVPAWYGQTNWPTDHRGPRNSDFSHYVVPTKTKIAWENLQREEFLPGASTVFAATEGVNGDLYITNARGIGFSQMHAFDQITGDTNFQAPIWFGGTDTIDSAAIAGTPTHDADGNFYVVDQDQFWSYDKDGEIRWVTELEPLGIESKRIFLNPVLTDGGLVGGVTLDGLMAFFNTDDGTLATPLGVQSEGSSNPGDFLADGLPGGEAGACNPAWLLLWAGGEVSLGVKRLVYCVFFGFEVEIANTAAISPRTGRLFIGGSGPTPEVGAMYGLDLIDVHPGDYNGFSQVWQIAWETNEPIGSAIGASATISPDGESVYVTDGSSTLHSFNTANGHVNFSNFGGDAAASPSVDMDGNLFAGAGPTLVSLDGKTGAQRFNINYNHVADQFLDPKPPVPFIIPNGNPTASIASVINLSPGKVGVPLSLGYVVTALEPILGRALPLPHANAIIQVDPATGLQIPGSTTQVPDGVEGAMTPTASGRIGVDQAVIFSSLGYYVLQNFLPLTYHVPDAPKAGYIALMPESFKEFY
jgi:hypothetical protein